MAKLTLSDVANIDSNPGSAAATINANWALIEAALENTLSRDGTAPNTMSAALDMNSNNIVNLPSPTAASHPTTKAYVDAIAISGTLPDMAGNNEGFLTTDGSSAFWTTAIRMDNFNNFFLGSMDRATGSDGTLHISNASVFPAAPAVGGGVMFVDAGALKYRGTSGASQVIVNADGTPGWASGYWTQSGINLYYDGGDGTDFGFGTDTLPAFTSVATGVMIGNNSAITGRSAGGTSGWLDLMNNMFFNGTNHEYINDGYATKIQLASWDAGRIRMYVADTGLAGNNASAAWIESLRIGSHSEQGKILGTPGGQSDSVPLLATGTVGDGFSVPTVAHAFGSNGALIHWASSNRHILNNAVYLPEAAAGQGSYAAYGQIWVRNDSPNTLMFTDDAGTDFVLGGAVGGGGGAFSESSPNVLLNSGAITDVWLSDTTTDPVAQNGYLNAQGGSGTNVAGADLGLRGGASTGSSNGGSITFWITPAGGAGSSPNAYVEAMQIYASGPTRIQGNVTAANVKLWVYANDAQVDGTMKIEQDGTGDSTIWYNLSGIGSWSTGIDQLDTNYVISPDTNVSGREFVFSQAGTFLINPPSVNAWGSNHPAIQIGETGGVVATAGTGLSNEMSIANNAYRTNTQWSYALASEEASRYYQVDGVHTFQGAGTGAAGGLITWTTLATISSTGDFIAGTAGGYHLDNSVSSTTNPTICPHNSAVTTGMGGTSGQIDMIVGGASVFMFDGLGAHLSQTTDSLNLPLNNDAVTPTLSFGDADSGFYEASDDNIYMALQAANRWYWSTTYAGSTNTNGAWLGYATPSATVPGFTFSGDTNTGIGRAGADLLSLISNGAEAARVDNDATAGNTRLLIYDVDNATLERVSVGAADSGGVGYKVLRILN